MTAWTDNIDPIGVGDIASLLWFALGRAAASKPVLIATRSLRLALKLRGR